MVNELEVNNPGCFVDPSRKFADLYMKSGLCITEIVKRLFRSPRMRELYPDDAERIRLILREQVYGMAPARIIYLIATNYILGFDEHPRDETKHFVQADAAQPPRKTAEIGPAGCRALWLTSSNQDRMKVPLPVQTGRGHS